MCEPEETREPENCLISLTPRDCKKSCFGSEQSKEDKEPLMKSGFVAQIYITCIVRITVAMTLM